MSVAGQIQPKPKNLPTLSLIQALTWYSQPPWQRDLGVIEAAEEKGKYIIGVDSDQASLLAETDEDKANVILTSVIKEVGESLYLYAEKVGKGEDKYGTTDVLGVKEETTGIVINDYYTKNVPQAIRDQVMEAEKAIVDGDIDVSTALGVNEQVVNEIVDSVKP